MTHYYHATRNTMAHHLLGVLGVGNLSLVYPVLRLCIVRIQNLLWYGRGAVSFVACKAKATRSTIKQPESRNRQHTRKAGGKEQGGKGRVGEGETLVHLAFSVFHAVPTLARCRHLSVPEESWQMAAIYRPSEVDPHMWRALACQTPQACRQSA